jgi:hypothetical protein
MSYGENSAKMVRNGSDDGWLPVCPYCDRPFGDGQIGEVKNYPDDGGAVVFFVCERCAKECRVDINYPAPTIPEKTA